MISIPNRDVAPTAKATAAKLRSIEETESPCYSARMLKPFGAVLEAEDRLPPTVRSWLSTIDPDERVHVSAVHAMLDAVVTLTGDEQLGIKASKLSTLGDGGLLDFVMSSAIDLRSALEVAERYMRLLNDTLDFTLELHGERAIVRLDNRVMLPAIAEDFQTCSLISSQAPCWPEGLLDDMDVWFKHNVPSDVSAYRDALGPAARLHFQAPFSGFGFPSRLLEAPLRSSNAKLHDVLLRYADLSLAKLPKPESVTERVKGLVASQLATGDFSLEGTARTLHMSPRTLGRRLADEGTTFKEIVDEIRKSVALYYVASRDIGLSEVALLAGFTETPSFYRAFRRWTGTTPSQYRKRHRGDLRGLR
jgi:AraC-like DNA-binding protein